MLIPRCYIAYVTQVPEAKADPQVRPLYRQIREDFGFVPNYFQALGRLPSVLDGHLTLSRAILNDGALSQSLKEQLGLVVSGINASSYCITAHMQILNRLGVEPTLGSVLVTDYSRAQVSPKDQALFRFADKLTRKPDEIEKSDVDTLFKAGWSDPALVEAVLTVAWFNLINRVSLGLGLVSDF
jgi:uncharacterized peroxidase-related enzyme